MICTTIINRFVNIYQNLFRMEVFCLKKFGKCIVSAVLAFALTIGMLPLRMGSAQALTMTYEPSSYYRASDYYSRLIAVPLTGNPKADLVNVAASQVGYHEGNSRSDLGGGNTAGSGNYTEYAYWFGPRVRNDNNFWYAWCAMFISWCARQAGIPESMINNSSMATCSGNPSLSGSYAFHIEKKAKASYTPEAGDIIFFSSDGTSSGQHVGIVESVSGGYVHTIEGNASNQVIRKTYALSSSKIVYYGVMNGAGSVTPPSYETTWDIGSYTVTASALNIRQYPTASSAKVGSYPNGTVVTIYEYLTDGSWGRTDDGWISMSYVSRRYETITTNAQAYERGTPITVNTGNTGSYPSAWIGLYRQGEVEDPYTAGGVEARIYAYVGNNSTVTFDTSSLDAGAYYVRAYCTGGISAYVKISDPVYFTITDGSQTSVRNAGMYTISNVTSINVRTAPQTGTITKTLNGGDIIPIYEIRDVPVGGGTQRWGRTDGGWIAMVSSADLATPYCVPYKKTISLSENYFQGSRIIATAYDISNAAYSGIWLGIYNAADTDRSEDPQGPVSVLWADAVADGSGNAVLSFPDQNQSDKGTSYILPAGNYYARLFCTVGDDAYIALSDKMPFAVLSSADTAVVSANASSYLKGETMKVTYGGGLLTDTAWIGLYPASQTIYNAENPSIIWQYVNSSGGDAYFPTTSLSSGAYKLVIFQDGGYTALNTCLIEIAPNDAVFTAAAGSYKITASALNIRSYPSTGTVYGLYYQNDVVAVYETYQMPGGSLWGRTDIGWIAMNYAVPVS